MDTVAAGGANAPQYYMAMYCKTGCLYMSAMAMKPDEIRASHENGSWLST